jgi:hypothetical protein
MNQSQPLSLNLQFQNWVSILTQIEQSLDPILSILSCQPFFNYVADADSTLCSQGFTQQFIIYAGLFSSFILTVALLIVSLNLNRHQR